MADRICDNCMSRVPAGSGQCPKCGITFENTNPGGALPNGWVLAGRYTVGRYNDIDGEGVTYSAIDGNTLQRVVIKEFMPVTLCASRDETGAIRPKPGNEVLFKTTRIDFSELYGTMLRMGLTEGLVQVLDVIEENNTAYAVLEKIEGPTLAEYLTKRDGAVDAARAVALLRPVLNGVEAMHTANLVHRGIAPENIILESGGTAKLSGYGTLALRQQGSELKPKLYAGYTAPEQYAANEFEGRYTDIYALGAVLYRLTTGEAPYPANERRMQDNLRPARTVNRDVPAYLSAGIARAMRLTPAERVQNIPDLRLALAGEGGGGRTGKPEGRGLLGLTKQQLMVGGIALIAIVVLLLIILLISTFTKNRGNPDASSSASISASESASVGETIPDFTGKRYDDVAKNSVYTDVYTFDEPVMEYSEDVEEGRIIRQSPEGGTTWDGTSSIKLWVSEGMEPVVMPDFVNTFTTQEDAEKKLKELEIEYTVAPVTNEGQVEPGTVTKTDPVAGTEVKPGKDKVVLYVAGDVKTISMPDITGRKEAEGIAELDRQGIKHRVNTIANSEGYHKVGIIFSTDPPAGGEVATGATTVNVNVLDKFYMPSLESYKGKPYTDLTKHLDKIGVPYAPPEAIENTIGTDSNGKVASIDYVVNAEVTASTKVVIKYYGTYADPGGDDDG